MAGTQVTETPTDKQRTVLQLLTGKRRISVIEKNGRKRTQLVTPSGKPVGNDTVDRAALEACLKKGWVVANEAGSDAEGTFTTLHAITEAGVKARKAK